MDHSIDFEPEDPITYRTFERAFDTHPEECSSNTVCTVEECSSSTVVVGTDSNDCRIASAKSDYHAIPKTDILDVEEKDGAEERTEMEVEVELQEEESKTDEEREEEINKEERRKIVAESMILYTAQLKSRNEKEEKEGEEAEVRLDIRIKARTLVEGDDRDEDDYEVMKVEKEVALCNSMPLSCIPQFAPTFPL